MAKQRPLKIGIMLPESEREMAGETAGWSDFLSMVRATEDCGFDSVWFCDHLLMKVPGHEPQGAWEAWSMLAAIAASTSRIEIGPFVSCTAYRNPALTAKIAETIDEISNGRLILALGSGWAEPEYKAFGYPFDHRASRFEEALTIIRSLIRTGHADFQGEYYSAMDCDLRPRGPRPDGMPIMIGTFLGERMMRLAAEHADHWNVWAQQTGNTPEGAADLNAKMDEVCLKVGRDPSSLERSCAVLLDFDHAFGRPGQSVPSLTGTNEEMARGLLAYKNAGMSHLQVYPDPCTTAAIERLAPVLELIDNS